MTRSEVDGIGSAAAGQVLRAKSSTSMGAGTSRASPTHAAEAAPLLSVAALGLRAGGLPNGRWLFERLGCDVRRGE